MQSLSYRDAAETDLPEIVRIYNSTVALRTVTADTEPVTVASKTAWFHQHGKNRPLWVAEDRNGAIIGWVSFRSFYGRPAYRHTAEISIYLDETKRGKGYGKQILQHAITRAAGYDIRTLLGFIFARNEPSLSLFRGLGFEQWGLLPCIAAMDGEEHSLVILGKRIRQ